jgi:hypothetical protein
LEQERLTVGGAGIGMATAIDWVSRYFDEEANRAAAAKAGGKPYAYPLYDRMETGSGPDELNDGDLLAPLLLNVGPSISAMFNLHAVRPGLEAVLARIPQDLTLQSAVAEGVPRQLIEPFGQFLDDGVSGVRGTILMKILPRKRPLFLPLYDTQVFATYCGTGDHPLRPDSKRSWAQFFPLLAEAMVRDLDSQPDRWKVLAELVPGDVSLLRILDVVAWRLGRSESGEIAADE